jgi:hypothetical protein
LSRRRGSLLGFDHMDMMTDQKVGADINGAKRKSRRLVQLGTPYNNEEHWKTDLWLQFSQN